ncbi:hypothetical protein SLNSH_04155 [Alsobacter soli]|uniref:Uncharacterized protein n=1 Tax=Alsobacter soli TaxID=2109933 RepID=A0A2T1HXR2_9HYPH|nr:hypothetical protein [Alsobacter soli]PSC06477.1 hypothetical protein SLNSH_04155 [Alsobacter soli]
MSRAPVLPAVLGLASAAALAACFVLAPRAAAQGSAVAGAVVLLAPLGGVALRMIQRLTGGRWGAGLAAPAARAPWLILAGGLALALVALDLGGLFPWAAAPPGAPGVARFYLNAPLLLARTGLILAGWIAMAVLADRNPSRLAAALFLVFHAVAVSVLATDWIVSLAPGFTNTSAGLTLATQQVLAALGVSALAGPDDRASPNIAGLMIAALLGVVYLGFMTYLVFWYGDLPAKAAWYVRRTEGAWQAVILAALLVGAAAPLGLLLLRSTRQGGPLLRVAGALVLIGSALHVFWLMAPDQGFFAALAAVLATTCAVALGVALPSLVRAPRRAARA